MKFTVEKSVSALGLSFCVVKLSGLTVEQSNSAVKKKKKQLTTTIKKQTDISNLSCMPHLTGYCELYERVGAGDEQIVSSCETLLRMIMEKGTLPTINTLVDLYNCVSALHGVTIGAHDAKGIDGDLRVAITIGKERFIPLGAGEEKRVSPGEYAYMDDKDILCRLDVRQCDKTKITTKTTEAFVFANSNPRMSDDLLLKACQHVCELVNVILKGGAEIIEFK